MKKGAHGARPLLTGFPQAAFQKGCLRAGGTERSVPPSNRQIFLYAPPVDADVTSLA